MSEDPFTILGIPATFKIDRADLQRKLVVAAARRHPDRAPDPVTAAAWTEELARLHEAAAVLEDDLARADVLIALRGGPAPSEDKTLPDGFLEEMLQVRMDLEEAMSAGDSAGRDALESWSHSEWEARRSRVAELLEGPEGDTPASLQAARHEVNRWRYAERMREVFRSRDGQGDS